MSSKKRKWRYFLRLEEFYHDDSLSVQEKAMKVSEKLDRLTVKVPEWVKPILEDIAYEFTQITTVEAFDDVMSRLYDTADSSDIWITTQGKGQ